MISVESNAEVARFRGHQQAVAGPPAWDEQSSLSMRLRLRREPWAGSEVRLRLVLATKGLLREDEQDLLRLLVTELINNSVQHAGPDAWTHVVVHISIAPERLRAVVCDGGAGLDPATAVPRPSGASALRGLQLVDRLATRWGTCAEDGSCVWFELDQAGLSR